MRKWTRPSRRTASPIPGNASKTLHLRHEQQWLRAALPLRAASPVATVFVSTTPAELILLRGAPQYEPVAGTGLLWVRNTDSDVFRLANGPLCYLVAGRWFCAPGLTSPWTFATPSPPEDFKRISLARVATRRGASGSGVVGTTGDQVFAGRDGNVYRREGDADRDLSARRDGGQRSRDAATMRKGGSRRGSYRPSGGGMRMGGGRRR